MRRFGLLICLFLCLEASFAQRKRSQQIDSLLTSVHSRGLFSGTALVADSGKIILHKAYGVSDRKSNQPIVLDDRFYIGSLTKQFTAVLILQLQEEGFVDINLPLSTYLKEFKDTTWANITIHHLLTHTSGLGNYTSSAGFDKSLDYSEDQMFELIKTPLLFNPGTSWNYSNSGYYLLGKIAERTTNKSYHQLVDDQIFSRLEMHSTGFDTTWLQQDVALGYWRTIEGFLPMPKYSLSSLFSSGGLYSTAGDLFKWDQALYTNQLLSDSSKNVLFNPIQNDYACGWFVKKGTDDNGESYERHFHGGWIKGYHAYILRRIPQKQVVILLDNSYSQEIQTIKNRVWSILVGEEVRKIKPKLSNLLFETSAKKALLQLIDSISGNLPIFEDQFELNEFDINTVAYRLMEGRRYPEAKELFNLNMSLYPESWNVYDSMGELELRRGNHSEAEKLYKKSLILNPQNVSAEKALIKIGLEATKPELH